MPYFNRCRVTITCHWQCSRPIRARSPSTLSRRSTYITRSLHPPRAPNPSLPPRPPLIRISCAAAYRSCLPSSLPPSPSPPCIPLCRAPPASSFLYIAFPPTPSNEALSPRAIGSVLVRRSLLRARWTQSRHHAVARDRRISCFCRRRRRDARCGGCGTRYPAI